MADQMVACAVDGPTVVFQGQRLNGKLTFYGNSVYGRVLFRSHGPVIRDCVIEGGIVLKDIRGCLIIGNFFEEATDG